MVSAPETNWTSVHDTRASRMASRAAASPYSTKLRPHLPQGCMPTPRTATLRSSGTRAPRSGRHGPPFPHQVLVVVILVEHVDDELDLGADGEVVHGDLGYDLAHHDHLLLGELDGGDAERHVGVGRDVGRGRRVAGVGVRPHLAPTAQGHILELGTFAPGVAAEEGLAGKGVGATGSAPAPEQG